MTCLFFDSNTLNHYAVMQLCSYAVMQLSLHPPNPLQRGTYLCFLTPHASRRTPHTSYPIPHTKYHIPQAVVLLKLLHIFKKCLRGFVEVFNRSAAFKNLAHLVCYITLVTDLFQGINECFIIEKSFTHFNRPHL